MAYVWSKSSVVQESYYAESSSSRNIVAEEESYSGLSGYTGYSGYSFNDSTGVFTLSGSQTNLQLRNYLYTGGGSSVVEWDASENSLPDHPADTYEVSTVTYSASQATRDAEGSFIENVTSTTRTTYPDNGVSGSYWYRYLGEQLVAPATITYSNPINTQTMSISWSAVSGSTKYYLEKSVNGGAYSEVTNQTGTSYTYTVSDTAGSTITFRVCGYNGIKGLYVTGSTLTVASTSNCKIKIGGVWKSAKAWVKVSGVWKEAQPYVKVSGVWKKSI